MPSTYAHYRLGQQVRRELEGNERKIIEKYLNTGGLEHDKREDPVGAIKVDECMEE